MARCNSEIYAVRKPGEIPLLFWHAKGLILMRQNQFNEACEQFDLVIEKTKDIPLYKPQYDQARKIRILAKFYQQMETKFKWQENTCIKNALNACVRKRSHDGKYEFKVVFEGSKDIDFYQNMFSKQIDEMNKEVQELDAECQCIKEEKRHYLIIRANVDPALEKKCALDFYQWLRPNLAVGIWVEMSAAIQDGVIFQSHSETPSERLVAMSEVIKPGVFFINPTGDKVEVLETMSEQDRLNIVGEEHREETEKQEAPGELSLFRSENSQTMLDATP